MGPIEVPFCSPGVPDATFACSITGQAGGTAARPAVDASAMALMVSIDACRRRVATECVRHGYERASCPIWVETMTTN